jgi:hypothetical protein
VQAHNATLDMRANAKEELNAAIVLVQWTERSSERRAQLLSASIRLLGNIVEMQRKIVDGLNVSARRRR